MKLFLEFRERGIRGRILAMRPTGPDHPEGVPHLAELLAAPDLSLRVRFRTDVLASFGEGFADSVGLEDIAIVGQSRLAVELPTWRFSGAMMSYAPLRLQWFRRYEVVELDITVSGGVKLRTISQRHKWLVRAWERGRSMWRMVCAVKG